MHDNYYELSKIKVKPYLGLADSRSSTGINCNYNIIANACIKHNIWVISYSYDNNMHVAT